MEEQIAEILANLQTAVTTLAPDIWAALVFAARIDSVLSLAFVAVWLSGTGYFIRKLPKLWELASERDLEPGVVIAGLVVGFVAIVSLVVLFDTSTWLGLFYPEAAVIRDLIARD